MVWVAHTRDLHRSVTEMLSPSRGNGQRIVRKESTLRKAKRAGCQVYLVDAAARDKLLSAEPVDRSAFIDAQNAIAAQFRTAVTVFPARSSMEATVLQAQKQWQSGLTTHGLWSNQLLTLHGNHSALNPIYGASSDPVPGSSERAGGAVVGRHESRAGARR